MKKLYFICFLLVTTQAMASAIGRVLVTENAVKVFRSGVEQGLSRGSALQVGDAILTGPNSSAKIKYNNGTLVTIGEKSHYVILAYSPNQNDVSINAELKEGKIHSTTSGGSKKEVLKTPTVALAILGTEYMVYIPHPPKKTFIQVDSGKVMADGMLLDVGQGYVATPRGVFPFTFPATGQVSTIESTAPVPAPSTVDQVAFNTVTQIVGTEASTAAVPVASATASLALSLSCAVL